MALIKEPTEKIFCLFHRKLECPCISPVTNNITLKLRLTNSIKINEINNKFETDLEMKSQREIENEDYQGRLEIPVI